MKKTLLALTAALLMSSSVFAQTMPLDKAKIEAIIKDYIMNNPEIISEAMLALEKKQAAAEEQARADILKNKKEQLINPKGAIISGNPKGDVTLVEFFDYNCGFCKRGFADVQDLIKKDPKVRVVLTDFPVLGQGSTEAARVSIAVKMQAKPEQYAVFHEKLLLGRGQANHDKAMASAKEAGLDMVRLEKDLASEHVATTIKANLILGDSLKISGTPSYVIGEEVLVGAVGYEAIKTRVEAARKAIK
jgi:protein-disulfide isomerase